MKKQFVSKRRYRKGSISFNPNRQFIEDAVEAYLQKGGTINQIEVDEESFEKSWMINDVSTEVDAFLNGQ